MCSHVIVLFVSFRFFQGIRGNPKAAEDGTRHLQPEDHAQGPLRQPARPGLGVLDRGEEEAPALPSETQGQWCAVIIVPPPRSGGSIVPFDWSNVVQLPGGSLDENMLYTISTSFSQYYYYFKNHGCKSCHVITMLDLCTFSQTSFHVVCFLLYFAVF